MSNIALKVKRIVLDNAREREYESIFTKVAKVYHKINDFFGVQHGTSDVFWFYGVYGFMFTAAIFWSTAVIISW